MKILQKSTAIKKVKIDNNKKFMAWEKNSFGNLISGLPVGAARLWQSLRCASTTGRHYNRASHVLSAQGENHGATIYEALPASKASIEELLEAGVHFGHRVTKWNPRMAPYIYGERALRTGDTRVHILDVVQTLHYLNETSKFLHTYPSAGEGQSPRALRERSLAESRLRLGSAAAQGRTPYANASTKPTQSLGTKEKNDETPVIPSILFVGTKKQARASIERAASRINGSSSTEELSYEKPHYHAHYVNHRWLGGLLTNWATMKLCIDLLHSFDEKSKTGALEKLPKKEQAIVKKQYQKLETFFGGMKTMQGRPNLVIIVGQDSEMNAVRECQKLQDSQSDLRKTFIPGTTTPVRALPLRTITFLDTNCNPQLADLFIPANDDSTKSIDYILQKLTDACIG